MRKQLLWFLLPLLVLIACDPGPNSKLLASASETARAILAEGDAIDSFDRISAAGVLLSAGSDEADGVIIDALTSGAALAQQAAVGALLSIPGEDSIHRIDSFADGSDRNLHSVLQALRWAPRSDARHFVLRGLEHSQSGTQVAAFDIAALLPGDSTLLAAIERAVSATDEEHVRGYGIYAAAALGSKESFALIGPLTQGKVFEREIAAACLGFVDTDASRTALRVLVEDSQPSVQLAAWASLSRFGDEHAAGQLYAALERPELSSIAAGAIRRASPATIEVISERAGNWSSIDVEAAGRVLEAIGWNAEANAGGGLARAIEDDRDELLKLQGLWAVGWRGREEERPLATSRLDDTSASVRSMAAWALVVNSHGGRKIGSLP